MKKDFFHLEERGTTVRREVLAGITTFMTMAYVLAVQPSAICGFGPDAAITDINGVVISKSALLVMCALVSGIITLYMGLYANLPLDAEALAFAAAKAYNVIVPLEFKKLADINDKIKVTNAITKAGVDKKHAKDFYAGKSQTIAEGIDIEQAEKMQEELRKSGIEMQVIPQKE